MLSNNDVNTDGGPVSGGRAIAIDYVHAVNPETGLDVVFVPGEALPDWAQLSQNGNARRDAAIVTPTVSRQGRRAVKGR